MSEGLPYADIIIIALIAGFILLRLRSVLGDKTGHDNPQFFMREMNKAQENKEKIVPFSENPIHIKPKKEEDPYLEKIGDEAIVQALKEIKNKDPFFNTTQFLNGAKAAFEMVFDAFVKSDRETLKMLLSKTIYDDFIAEMEKRDSEENKTETTLVAVLSRDIVGAECVGKVAHVTAKFVSEQVTVVRNPKGEIIDGDASQTEHVENEWVFERDTGSKNPNWKIIET